MPLSEGSDGSTTQNIRGEGQSLPTDLAGVALAVILAEHGPTDLEPVGAPCWLDEALDLRRDRAACRHA